MTIQYTSTYSRPFSFAIRLEVALQLQPLSSGIFKPKLSIPWTKFKQHCAIFTLTCDEKELFYN